MMLRWHTFFTVYEFLHGRENLGVSFVAKDVHCCFNPVVVDLFLKKNHKTKGGGRGINGCRNKEGYEEKYFYRKNIILK